MSTNHHTTILDLFQSYKQFYLSQIASQSLDKDTKLSFMSQVIDNLMEQNEQLLMTIIEIQQSAKDRSMQLHSLLERTASRSCEVGLALSSFEIKTKCFVNNSIPSFVECADLIGEINSHVDHMEKENEELRKENRAFFENVQNQSAELMQYKKMVYRLMAQPKSSLPQKFDDIEVANTSYLESVLTSKLTEANETVNTAVCANVLQEMVSAVEMELENVNNIHCIVSSSISNEAIATSTTAKSANSSICDINDNYELDDSTCDSSFVDCLRLANLENAQDESISYLEYDLKAFRPQVLSLLSILCNELAFKTPVIYKLKRQLSNIKSEHLSLHNRHFQMAIQVLSTFVHLKNELEAKLESSQMKQRLMEKLDVEMGHVLATDSGAFALANVLTTGTTA